MVKILNVNEIHTIKEAVEQYLLVQKMSSISKNLKLGTFSLGCVGVVSTIANKILGYDETSSVILTVINGGLYYLFSKFKNHSENHAMEIYQKFHLEKAKNIVIQVKIPNENRSPNISKRQRELSPEKVEKEEVMKILCQLHGIRCIKSKQAQYSF